jgi:hypothetical protein
MSARGDVGVKSVVPPETALEPGIFFGELRRLGIGIHERLEQYHAPPCSITRIPPTA